MKISILVPTRNRPQMVEALYNSAMSLADNSKNIEFSFYLDEDDIITPPKLQELNISNLNIIYTQGPRIVLSSMWNKAYEKATGEILWHGGDDNIIKTKGWDSLVIEAFNQYKDRIVLVGGKDLSGHHDGKFFTHGFIHRNWINAVGYLFRDLYSSDYNDTHLNDIARMINRWHYVEKLEIEHIHPAWSKRGLDKTDLDRHERHRKDNVAEIYDRDYPARVEAAKKLQEFINNFKE